MKLVIEYEASWRNSFLDGSNNERLPKKGRNFIATSSQLSKNTYFHHEVTKDTVMGLLNRLVGEQRKLYQSREDPNYYFKDIEEIFDEIKDIQDNPRFVSDEVVYLRNIGDSEDRNSFAGLIKDNVPIFKSTFAGMLWGVLFLSLEDLYSFVLDKNFSVPKVNNIGPLQIVTRISEISETKDIAVKDEENYNKALEIFEVFKKEISGYKFESGKPIKAFSLYFSSLYLQIERMRKAGLPIDESLTAQKKIPGISLNNFTLKDFMGKFGGGKKKAWGCPYILKERVKGEGEISHKLKKQSGTLTINLRIARQRAEEIKQKIEEAAVATFYLGKKGLAYLVSIDTRESI